MSLWKLCLLCAAVYCATGVLVHHYVDAMGSAERTLSRRIRTDTPAPEALAPPVFETPAVLEAAPARREVREGKRKRERPRRIEIRQVSKAVSGVETETRSSLERRPSKGLPGRLIVVPVQDS